MAGIAPFRALTYARHLRAELDRLVAPPYDVLSEAQRSRLIARHENNVVHVDLPRPPAGDEAYAGAARTLDRWIHEEVLERDTRPCFYACEQRYRRPTGGEAVRRGFFARLTLEPFGSGSVIPHERTLDKPRADRLRLLAATRTHLSAVFVLHPDPARVVADTMAGMSAVEPILEARDDEGTVSRVTRLADAEHLEALTRCLRDQWVLMADGHHRYEAALAYRDRRRAQGLKDAEHVLAFLCSLEDSGLSIYPIHRLVHSLREFDAGRFRERLAPRFRLQRVQTREELRQTLFSRSDRPGVFGLVFPEDGLWVAEWSQDTGPRAAEPSGLPEPLRRLDVVLLHGVLLEEILGITAEDQARQTHLDYVKEIAAVYERVAAGGVQLGILMNPTRIQQVVEVTGAGFRLPQKSTYFYPKVLTGLVFDPLD
jgi:uncharacterized protein (DUF1015 family)